MKRIKLLVITILFFSCNYIYEKIYIKCDYCNLKYNGEAIKYSIDPMISYHLTCYDSYFNPDLKNSPKYSSLDINLSIRVGINTGMVTTGAVGKEREGDYTVYGDTVNLASRMESNAPINTIMVAEDTMELVKDYFIFKDHGFVEVKGKSKPISVFVLQSKKDLSMNISTPFIGREKEIKILKTNQENFKDEIEKNKDIYEKIIDEAAEKIETFIQKANSDNQIQ